MDFTCYILMMSIMTWLRNYSWVREGAETGRVMIKSRGDLNIDAKNVWNEWLSYKNTKNYE